MSGNRHYPKPDDTPRPSQGFQAAMGDDESLALFMRQMIKFDREFCNLMAEGNEFTIRLEVHGHGGRLLHARVYEDENCRPSKHGANPQKSR